MTRQNRMLSLSVVCFALAGVIVAAETGHCAEKPDSVAKLTALYGGSVGLELAATEYALAKNPHAHEANPLGPTTAARIGTSVGSTALLVWSTKSLQAHGHPGTARWMKRLVVAARVGLAIHDFRQGESHAKHD